MCNSKTAFVRLEEVMLIRLDLVLLVCADQGSAPTLVVVYCMVQEAVFYNTFVPSTVTHRKYAMENLDLDIVLSISCFRY